MFFSNVALTTVLLARLAMAQAGCGVACGNYGTTLSNCASLYDQDVQYIGKTFTDPTKALNCMCNDWSDILTCDHCVYQGYNLGSGNGPYTSTDLLIGWVATCGTWSNVGVSQAYSCWTGLPDDISNCYIPSVTGSAASSTAVPAVAPTQSSSPVTSSSSSASTPSSAAAPSTSVAKSSGKAIDKGVGTSATAALLWLLGAAWTLLVHML